MEAHPAQGGYTRWLGRTQSAEDRVTAAPLRGLPATLDLAVPATRAGEPIAPGWHLNGRPEAEGARLWIADYAGNLAMSADAVLA
jgi:hypothetical protein